MNGLPISNDPSRPKALVIGGSGLSGPHIVEGLRARGLKVAVLNRGVHPYPFPHDAEHPYAHPKATVLGRYEKGR